jgi:hypothetical protein
VRVEHFTKLDSDEWTQRVFTSLAQELLLKNFGIAVPIAEIDEGVEITSQAISPDIADEKLLQK